MRHICRWSVWKDKWQNIYCIRSLTAKESLLRRRIRLRGIQSCLSSCLKRSKLRLKLQSRRLWRGHIVQLDEETVCGKRVQAGKASIIVYEVKWCSFCSALFGVRERRCINVAPYEQGVECQSFYCNHINDIAFWRTLQTGRFLAVR